MKFRILDSGFAGSGVKAGKELNELKKLNELSLSIVAEELRLYPIRPERAEATCEVQSFNFLICESSVIS